MTPRYFFCFLAASLVISCETPKPVAPAVEPVVTKKPEEPVAPVAPVQQRPRTAMKEPEDTLSLPTDQDLKHSNEPAPSPTGAAIRVSPPAEPKQPQ